MRYLITKQNTNNEVAKTDGALFVFGYKILIAENLIVEIGFETFLL